MIPAEINYFNWVDAVSILLTLLFVFFGYIRGFVKEFLSLFSWGTALTSSIVIYPYVSNLFVDLIKIPVIRSIVGFILTFVTILMLFLVATSMLSEKVAATCFNDVNKAIGGVFGIVKSCVILICACLIVIVFMPKGECMNAINKSKMGFIFKDIAISICDSAKKIYSSPQFKELCETYTANIANKKFDSETVTKDLSIPKISQTIYKKTEKTRDVVDERDKRRESFIRKQVVFGPQKQETQKKKDSVSAAQKQHKELIDNLQKNIQKDAASKNLQKKS